jgi:glutamate--cysteine ligase
LRRRGRLDAGGHDETQYLLPLRDVAARGFTSAEELLQNYRGPWGGKVDAVFAEYAH